MRSMASRMSLTRRMLGIQLLSTATSLWRMVDIWLRANQPSNATNREIRVKPRPARRAMVRLRKLIAVGSLLWGGGTEGGTVGCTATKVVIPLPLIDVAARFL